MEQTQFSSVGLPKRCIENARLQILCFFVSILFLRVVRRHGIWRSVCFFCNVSSSLTEGQTVWRALKQFCCGSFVPLLLAHRPGT